MLEARDLYCERDERTLFRGLSFTVEAGEWVQVTGGNGAGKTTLLRLLTGLARPDGGEVYWQGEPLRRVRDSFHRSLLWIGHQLSLIHISEPTRPTAELVGRLLLEKKKISK
ncbi:ATP-binding cassette domain-containing protein, partial [Salmonella enterica]|uniref:ATP-binding cassette domain-containing protein n=1 Tax=Salmonella enterica TaxID=28901 RepID=UPI00217F905B